MSGRLYFGGAISTTAGFGLSGSNFIIHEDIYAMAIGPLAEVSHVFVSAANFGDAKFLVGVNTPFVGQHSIDGSPPFYLKNPIVVTPYLVGVGSYKMDLFYYSVVPVVIPMLRGPISVDGTGQLGTQWCHGRRLIRYMIKNATGSGAVVPTFTFYQVRSGAGSGQSVAGASLADGATGIYEFNMNSNSPAAFTGADAVKVTTSIVPAYHCLEIFD